MEGLPGQKGQKGESGPLGPNGPKGDRVSDFINTCPITKSVGYMIDNSSDLN